MTLEDIFVATRAESQLRQERHPLATLQQELGRMKPTRGFAAALRARRFSVIAEIKRKSPSMGSINPQAIDDAHEVYSGHPAVAAISVLTQNRYFGGSVEDVGRVRELTQARPKPILRKDFILSEYEVYFSRWMGADAILLMASVLETKAAFRKLHDLALSLELDVLCEVHDESELAILPDNIRICGVNSRRFKGVDQRVPLALKVANALGVASADRDTRTDLDTFELFEKLAGRLPSDCLTVAESGISAGNIGAVLRKHPFNAALIGTSLLKSGKHQMSRTLDRIQAEADLALGPAAAKTGLPLAL